jgi:hypothetical protein
MTLQPGVRHIAVALVLAVLVGQLWNLFGLSQTSAMTSEFVFDSNKCVLRASSDLLRDAANRLDDKASSLLTVEGKEIRIWTQSSRAGEAMFQAQKAALLRAVDCGTSPWCEGKGADDTYADDQLPLVQRKRKGEPVVLRGCEMTADDFHPVSYEVRPPAARRLDALTIIAFAANLIVLLVLLRPARK